MEYVLYGIAYIVCGYATFRAWAYLEPPVRKNDNQNLWCSKCHQRPAVEAVKDKEWVIDGDPLLGVILVCLGVWPIVLVVGGCILAANSAIPKTKIKRSSADSQDLLEEDFTALERKKHAHTP